MYCIIRTRVINQDDEIIYAHVVSDKEGHRRQVYSVGPMGILIENLPDILLKRSKKVACVCMQALDLLPRQKVECPFCHSINVIYGNIHHSNEFYRYVSSGGLDEWKSVDKLTEELK